MRLVTAIRMVYSVRMVSGVLRSTGVRRYHVIMAGNVSPRGLPSRVMNDGGRRKSRRERKRTIDFTAGDLSLKQDSQKKKRSNRVEAVLERVQGGSVAERLLKGLENADDDSETWIEVITELVSIGMSDQVRPYTAKHARKASPEAMSALARRLASSEMLGFLSEVGEKVWFLNDDFVSRARPARCYGPLVCGLLRRYDTTSGPALRAIARWSEAEALFCAQVADDEEDSDIASPLPYNAVLKQARSVGALDALFATLEVMAVAGVSGDDQTFEAISTAAARSVRFVTGAVSTQSLPPESIPEAVFLGRSNVGKSSLINMLTNRKSAAFTSKRPGKTQQFNFFEVNGDTPEKVKGLPPRQALRRTKWRPRGRFYLVDVPGLGYAEVPTQARVDWRNFLEEYLNDRARLSLVFHLIDSRHPPTRVDHEIFDLVTLAASNRLKNNQPPLSFVIVLTKADKREARTGPEAIDSLRAMISQHLNPSASSHDETASGHYAAANTIPILVTSSETRYGRDAIWRHLSKAALLSSSSS